VGSPCSGIAEVVPPPVDLRSTAASLGGQGLRAVTSLVSAVRPAAKPLHPRGAVLSARLRRFGVSPSTGVPWLDEAGDDEVAVRISRAVGLPGALPDIHGLALRVPTPRGPGDLLLATTGFGHLTRFVLTAARTPVDRPMTTLLPYRTPTGPVLVGATARDESTWELAVASLSGPWRRFAELTMSEEPGDDEHVDFDPVLHQVPGLETYGWVRRLREPSYRTARRSRGDE
jgi:hypothetical protein